MRLFRTRKPLPTAPEQSGPKSWDWISSKLAELTHAVIAVEARVEAHQLQLAEGLKMMERKAKRAEMAERRLEGNEPSGGDGPAQLEVLPDGASPVGWRDPKLVASALKALG